MATSPRTKHASSSKDGDHPNAIVVFAQGGQQEVAGSRDPLGSPGLTSYIDACKDAAMFLEAGFQKDDVGGLIEGHVVPRGPEYGPLHGDLAPAGPASGIGAGQGVKIASKSYKDAFKDGFDSGVKVGVKQSEDEQESIFFEHGYKIGMKRGLLISGASAVQEFNDIKKREAGLLGQAQKRRAP